jgi:hypothetical protein
MTTAEALRIAAKRVRIHHFAEHQYQVDHWSTQHNAWWQGQMVRREAALHAAWEAKVCAALELLGIDDAGALAASAAFNAYPKDWRQAVRDELKADRLVEAQS